jgi:hypothetical protein
MVVGLINPSNQGQSVPLRGDRAAIEQRRALVKEMMVRSMPLTAIAQAIGVHRNTIMNDAKEIRRSMRQSVKDIDPVQAIADSVEIFNMVVREAIVQFHSSEGKASKVSFLKAITEAEATKLKFMMTTGLLPNHGLEQIIDAEVSSEKTKRVEGKFEKAGLGEVIKSPESRRKILSAFQKFLTIGKKEIMEAEKREEGVDGGQSGVGGPDSGAGTAEGGTPPAAGGPA